MNTEEEDLQAKIRQLAGKIDQHKSGQSADKLQQSNSYARSSPYGGYHQQSTGWRGRGGYSTRGYSRGGRGSQVHRNRTLVLNGNTPITSEEAANENEKPTANGNITAPAWITKTDRHLQLINKSIFEVESQKRKQAIEQTRLQKLKLRDEREKKRLFKHLHRPGHNSYTSSVAPALNHELNVDGIRFRVMKNGSKLVKVSGEDQPTKIGIRNCFSESAMDLQFSGDQNAAKSTPKITLVGGVRFHRSKNGNMYRAGIIKAHRRTGVVKKINEPCKIFTTTGIPFLNVDLVHALKARAIWVAANIHSSLGSCPKGPRCRYIHDPTKVAVCKDFLKGSCPSGDSCDFSHELTPERTPTCLHFAKGNCSNANCRYTHVRVSPTAPLCRDFGIYGYCEKGASCTDRHVSNECPDFSNTGRCSTKGCKLPHRHKASVMRNNISRSADQSPDEESDISSDDEEIGSDDIDSDDLDEEFLGDEDGEIDSDIPMQQDYVQLS